MGDLEGSWSVKRRRKKEQLRQWWCWGGSETRRTSREIEWVVWNVPHAEFCDELLLHRAQLIQQAGTETNLKKEKSSPFNATSTQLILSLSAHWAFHSAHSDRLEHYFLALKMLKYTLSSERQTTKSNIKKKKTLAVSTVWNEGVVMNHDTVCLMLCWVVGIKSIFLSLCNFHRHIQQTKLCMKQSRTLVEIKPAALKLREINDRRKINAPEPNVLNSAMFIHLSTYFY